MAGSWQLGPTVGCPVLSTLSWDQDRCAWETKELPRSAPIMWQDYRGLLTVGPSPPRLWHLQLILEDPGAQLGLDRLPYQM